MLRITIHDDDATATLELQGKLAGDWVNEVLETWTMLISTGRPVNLDLSEVSFVDRPGRQLLSEMHARGVQLAGSGLMIRGLIEEITHVSS